jgi:uncharacterized Ntn-hydrolase superfamily protein
MLGVAVSTAIPAVGAICRPFAEAGVGAIATQSWVNPYLAIDGLKLLRQGLSAQEALDRLLSADADRDLRQLAIVDSRGGSAAFSGSKCTTWFGHITGDGYSVQGNMLVSKDTIDCMVQAFESNAADDLPERLMKTLEAGQDAGGDKRGRQSASLYVVKSEEYAYVDLRADEHPQPVAELRRIFEIAKVQVLPFVESMPTRESPLGTMNQPLMEFILRPPSQRS